MIQGPDGAAWLTDGGLNAIVRAPDTGQVKAWRLPEETGYANLNTAAFDPCRGTLVHWPSRHLWPPRARVRGDAHLEGSGRTGALWDHDDAGRANLLRFARGLAHRRNRPATGEKRRIDPSTPDQGARRVWSDSMGRIWVSEWNSGQLSRLPRPQALGRPGSFRATGRAPTRSTSTPLTRSGSATSAPMRCSASTRKSERFMATYPGSEPNANVRQILGRNGEVFLPESGSTGWWSSARARRGGRLSRRRRNDASQRTLYRGGHSL